MNKCTHIFNTILACLLLVTSEARAIQISSSGDSWTVDWLVSASTTTGLSNDLTATSSWLVSSFSATEIVLDISITNTTVLGGGLGNADITSFGFGVTPNASGSIVSQGQVFAGVSTGAGPQQNYPGGYKGIDVCVFSSGCAGGSVNDALHAGMSDTITLLLSGNFSQGTVDLLYFPLKFQTSQGSYEPAGCINGNGCTPTQVAEPSVPALMLAGLLVMLLMRRLRPALARRR